MFARVVGCQSKAGRSEQAGKKLKNDVLPILQKQPGFIDLLTLSDKANPERLVCISLWTSRGVPMNITASTMTRSPKS
jgi:heme-degrading monooxygenase HmoA